MINMNIFSHGWNLVKFRTEKIEVPWLVLFLYNKMSIKNSFVQCPIAFVCDLHFSPAAQATTQNAKTECSLTRGVHYKNRTTGGSSEKRPRHIYFMQDNINFIACNVQVRICAVLCSH